MARRGTTIDREALISYSHAPMGEIAVQVQPDHLERLSTAKKPVNALIELIWNGLDADATNVRVDFERNRLEGLEKMALLTSLWKCCPVESSTEERQLGGERPRIEPSVGAHGKPVYVGSRQTHPRQQAPRCAQPAYSRSCSS